MPLFTNLHVLIFVLCSTPLLGCLAAIYDDAAALPTTSFDFVIVGAGAAGAVIANRLTEEEYSVLLIEAGPSNAGVENIAVPYMVTALGSTYDWNYTTTPQSGLNGRPTAFPRGFVLGGSTSVNAMIYTRGSPDDWNRYAALTGDSGWSWDAVQMYIAKNEKWIPPVDGHNTTGEYDPSIHSSTGINAVSLPGFPHPTNDRIIQTTRELPDEFPLILDMNPGQAQGVGWLQATINDGARSSSAASYLGSNFINRPNLHILLGSYVTRVLQTISDDDEVKFDTVEFIQSSDETHTVTAVREIVLSAGAIGSPHILLNSGIGDSSLLSSLGIPVILDLPDVGKNLSDQPSVWNKWTVNSTDTWDDIFRNETYQQELLKEWRTSRTGPMVDSHASYIAWNRLPADSPIFEKYGDPSAGPGTPHIELGLSNGWNIPLATLPKDGHFVGAGVSVVTPQSRGSVWINSSNPVDPPLIDPGYLTHDFDVFALVEALKSSLRFFAAPAWSDYVLAPYYEELANATTDEEIVAFIRANAGTAAHPVGTASMSPVGSGCGVVNPDLKVKGATGLRVVDASILPMVPSAHTQVPTYFVAERAADLIKASWT